MKKNGFIATSLIYSFFLVFCAVLLSFLTMSSHNKNLLDKANEDIRNDLRPKKLIDVPIGSYLSLDITHPDFNTDVNWVLFDKSANASFISDGIVISYNNGTINNIISTVNSQLSSFSNACFIVNARLLAYSDIDIIKNNMDTKYVTERIMNVTPNYVVQNSSNYLVYNFPIISSDSLSFEEYKNEVFANSNFLSYSSGNVNLRLVVTLNSNDQIIGGNGSKNNPYHISC